eukprot:jgi/Ulvmu1/759/UM010_0133.1
MEAIVLGKEILSKLFAGSMPSEKLISLFISKALGLGILAGACITKLPQIIGVYKSKSGEGLPLLSSELENYVYLIHISYGMIMGLPVTAFGEAAVTWAQNIVLLMLLYRFKNASMLRPMMALLVVAMVAGPVSQSMIDQATIAKLYDLNSTVYMASKLPQIIAAFQQGKTGQLSFFTNFLQFVGSLARIFTSVKEGAGMPMVRGFIMGSLLNGTTVAQILYYGKDGRKPGAEEAEKEVEKKAQ